MALPIAANKMDTDLNQDGCGELEQKGRVYNGKPIGKEDIPWMVQIAAFYDLSSDVAKTCAGSIITRNIILTASHCLFEPGAFALKVMVLYDSKLNVHGKAYLAEKMMVHPKYVSKTRIVHDIALLKLAVDLEFNRLVKPVCLPTEKMNLGGKTLVVAGWGRTESAKESKVILHAELVALTDAKCKKVLRRYANPFTLQRLRPGPAVCAYGRNKGACKGDSGGPLTLANDDGRTVQVGIVSFGMRCPSTIPTVYTSVSSHMKWIRRALNHPRRWRKLEYTRHRYNMG